MNVALLPAKPLHLAKTRLGSVLAPHDRAALARAMFEDVLAALTCARHLEAILVVTADAVLADRALHAGAIVIDEGSPRGLNGAVALGTERATQLGMSGLLVVLSDIPHLEASDIDELIERAPAYGTLLVPCKEGTGTNAILRRPPSVFATRFGGRSLERHVAEASRLQLACDVVRNARLEFDVDTPEDLIVLASEESRTATYREITRLGLGPMHPTA